MLAKKWQTQQSRLAETATTPRCGLMSHDYFEFAGIPMLALGVHRRNRKKPGFGLRHGRLLA